jgi:hypothetical protein
MAPVLQASAVLMAGIAIAFGAPAPFVAAHLLRNRALPMFMGLFPAYGGGLADGWSPESFATLLGLFTALSAVELFAAVLLWQGLQLGAMVTLALLPFEIAFWLAFALPIPPIAGVVRTVLLWAGWSTLR